jgi:hypothetical protein
LSLNGRLQQIAANRFSTPQDLIAILLQGFVLPFLPLIKQHPFCKSGFSEVGHLASMVR